MQVYVNTRNPITQLCSACEKLSPENESMAAQTRGCDCRASTWAETRACVRF